jgi:HAE1 family hydrophobic/amphiphilic exporter-1
VTLPPGCTLEAGGGFEQQTEAFGQLFAALGASVLLTYLLMAILYNSFVDPLVILFSLPVAVGGAVAGLVVFGYSFNIFALIGLILLVGLAIKNGILLVDRANQNRERGLSPREALLEAGPARLRPILMTSVASAVALAPTAFQLGDGAELRAPLAAAVLGGVISSTSLTLLVVPVMYSLLKGSGPRRRWSRDAVRRRPRWLHWSARPPTPVAVPAEAAPLAVPVGAASAQTAGVP